MSQPNSYLPPDFKQTKFDANIDKNATKVNFFNSKFKALGTR